MSHVNKLALVRVESRVLNVTVLTLGGVLMLLMLGAWSRSLAQKATKQSVGQITITKLSQTGTTTLGGQAASTNTESGLETRTGLAVDAHFSKQISGTISPARVPSDHVPTPNGNAIVGADAGFFGFNGITHRDQRLAGNNTQFSLEPPDQGLAVGKGFVLEAVNDALAVYDTSGNRLAGPSPLNAFFNLAPEIIRSNPPVFGPFLSDPKCYFDPLTQRWFVTELEIDVDPNTGNFLGHSTVVIAVSTTSDPTDSYLLYSLDATDDTGTPDHAGCPCFGDQPLIGADANGFYISTNEFSIFGPNFNGAQIYAMSKTALVAGTLPPVVHFSGLPLAEGPAFSVQPTTTPPGGLFEQANGGTEYFLSSLDFTGTLDNRIAVWALTNTSSLGSATPNIALTNVVINSEVYGLPPATQQQPGATPLANQLKEHLELIDGDDDRMQQAVFAAGKLWTALGTVVKTPNGPTRVGVAYFIVTPSWSGNNLVATIANQGYVSVNQESLIYPSIGVNAAGNGMIVSTLVGPDFFPGAAYVPIDAVNGAGAVRIAAPGAGPDDGFTGYQAFGGSRVGRFGDYSAAVADADGSVWMATEYIPNLPRTVLANWGTFISKVNP